MKILWRTQFPDSILGVSWSPDGSRIALIAAGGQAWILDSQSGRILHQLPGHKDGGFQIAWNPVAPESLASSGQDGLVRFWNPDSGLEKHQFPAGAAWVEHLAWSPDGLWLGASAGRHLKLWNRDQGAVSALPQHASTISGLSWNANGCLLASACYGAVQVWDAATGGLRDTLPWKTSLISVAWSPSGRWMAAGTQELSVQIWELPYQPGNELAMSGYPTKVLQLAWHSLGRLLATGGGEQAMVWDCSGAGPAGTEPRMLDGDDSRLSCLEFQPGGNLLAGGTEQGSVILWAPMISGKPTALVDTGSRVNDLRWNKQGDRLGVATRDGWVAVAAPGPA